MKLSIPTANINLGIYLVVHFNLKESVVFWIKSYDHANFYLFIVVRIDVAKKAMKHITKIIEHKPPVNVWY